MHDPTLREIADWPITVILNGRSGRANAEENRARIEQALEAAGREFRIYTIDDPGEIAARARQVVAEATARPRIIAAAGGDGTLNGVASALIGTGLPFGAIPLGTFNYFARALGIPPEPGEAAAILARGRVRRVTVARVNGHIALINASLGLHRRILEEREQRERQLGRGRLVALISGLLTLLSEHRTYDLHLRVDGRDTAVRTSMVFFGLNDLQLEQLGLEKLDCAARDLLTVVMLRPMGRWDLLALALRGALQGLAGVENLRCHCASQIELRWRAGRRMRITVDGEILECTLPLRVETLPAALPVIVPEEAPSSP